MRSISLFFSSSMTIMIIHRFRVRLFGRPSEVVPDTAFSFPPIDP
jgi:hypothetical protein